MLGLRAKVEVVAPGTFPRTDFKARRVIDDRDVFRELNARLADRRMMGTGASLDLVPGVLAGDTRAIARLLSRAEAGADECRPALDAIFRRAGRAHVVGITGVPGSGKSTLVAKLAAEIRRSGRRVAIVAIDPSSPFSGGAILGDRIRMGDAGGGSRRVSCAAWPRAARWADSRAARWRPSTSSMRRVTTS